MKDYQTDIEQWEQFTQYLAEDFQRKYFGKDCEVWWVAGEIGGTLHINDYFFSLDDILECLRGNVTKKDMFAFYDYQINAHLDPKVTTVLNRKHWKKSLSK